MQIDFNQDELFTVKLALFTLQARAKADVNYHKAEIAYWDFHPETAAEHKVSLMRAERKIAECEALLKRIRLETL